MGCECGGDAGRGIRVQVVAGNDTFSSLSESEILKSGVCTLMGAESKRESESLETESPSTLINVSVDSGG